MRKRILCAVSCVVFIAVTMALSGCSTSRISLSDQDYVSVEEQSSEKIKILWTDVYQEEGQTWMYGVLKQPSMTGGTIKTHVDIQILASDGAVHYETTSKELYVPRNRVGKGPDWKRFRVKLVDDIPEGAKVLVKVHSGKYKDCFEEMKLVSNNR